MKISFKLGLILIVCLLTACQPGSSFLLEGADCDTPCWRNIKIGSFKDETIAALYEMTDIQVDSIKITDPNIPYDGDFVYWWFKNGPGGGGEIKFSSGTVGRIYLGLKNEISLSQFVEKYGPPAKVLIYQAQLDGIMLNAYLIYPDAGICLVHGSKSLFLGKQDQYRLSASTKIGEIAYIDTVYSNWLSDKACLGGFSDEALLTVQDWNGYEQYTVYTEGVGSSR